MPLTCSEPDCTETAHRVSPENPDVPVDGAALLAVRVANPSTSLCS